jgi:hypothetical protein
MGLMVVLELLLGAKYKRVSLSAAKSKALVLLTVPTLVQVVPPLVL